jgi:hypothetical protein
VECEPDKSNRQQDGAGYDQPMWISHLKHSQLSRRFSLLEYLRTTFRAAPVARRRGDYDCSFCIIGPLADLLNANPTAVRRRARRLKWGTSKERATRNRSACYNVDVPNRFLGTDASLRGPSLQPLLGPAF